MHGAAVVLNFKALGKFVPSEMPESINTKECLAIYYGVRSFVNVLHHKHVCVRSDSTTAVSSANKMGSCSSPVRDQIMRDLWEFCELNEIWLTVVHIAGSENGPADDASRRFSTVNDRTEWAIPQEIFDKIHNKYPEIDVDLFASYGSAKMEKFVAWKFDPIHI